MKLDIIMKYVNARMTVLEAAISGGSNVYEQRDQRDAHDALDEMLREEIEKKRK